MDRFCVELVKSVFHDKLKKFDSVERYYNLKKSR